MQELQAQIEITRLAAENGKLAAEIAGLRDKLMELEGELEQETWARRSAENRASDLASEVDSLSESLWGVER